MSGGGSFGGGMMGNAMSSLPYNLQNYIGGPSYSGMRYGSGGSTGRAFNPAQYGNMANTQSQYWQSKMQQPSWGMPSMGGGQYGPMFGGGMPSQAQAQPSWTLQPAGMNQPAYNAAAQDMARGNFGPSQWSSAGFGYDPAHSQIMRNPYSFGGFGSGYYGLGASNYQPPAPMNQVQPQVANRTPIRAPQATIGGMAPAMYDWLLPRTGGNAYQGTIDGRSYFRF